MTEYAEQQAETAGVACWGWRQLALDKNALVTLPLYTVAAQMILEI